MGRLKGTQTEKNILTAFAGESQARNRYTYFASAAKKEGFEQISGIFNETADNEKEHAKRLFKLLEGGEVNIAADFPAGVVGSTRDNLMAAMDGEIYEHSSMYPTFARIATEEGFDDIAAIFNSIAVAEKHHAKRFKRLLTDVQNDSVFKKDTVVSWRCRNCGYVHEGNEPPERCPACDHAKAYFEVLEG